MFYHKPAKVPKHVVSRCCRAEVEKDKEQYFSEKLQKYKNKTVFYCTRPECGKRCTVVDFCAHKPKTNPVDTRTKTGDGKTIAICAKCDHGFECSPEQAAAPAETFTQLLPAAK